MAYELYPAVDENYNFPPVVRQALAKSNELRNQVVPMSTVDRNNLVGDQLWDGRLIVNTDTDQINQYDIQNSTWSDGLPHLHSEYLLREGDGNVAQLERLLQRTDERNTTLNYTSGKLTSVVDKDGANTVKTTTLAYSGDTLTTVTEQVDGLTITTTLNYTSGTLTSITRSVT